ncbi:MAG: hypothetical protein AAFX09_09980 [Pseudomonadota bacterium]
MNKFTVKLASLSMLILVWVFQSMPAKAWDLIIPESEEVWVYVFDLFDTNATEYLSIEEFVLAFDATVLSLYFSNASNAFSYLDTNNDNLISIGEWLAFYSNYLS